MSGNIITEVADVKRSASTEIDLGVKAEVDGAAEKDSITGNPALVEHARAIRELARRTREDIIAIGRHLAEARKHVDHGAWLDWIDAEFGWSDQTARRFIHVYELSCDAKFNTLVELDLPLGVLYQLAAPKSEEARQKVVEHVEAGEKPSSVAVTDIITQAKNKSANSADEIEYAGGEDDEDPSVKRRRAEHAALFAESSDSDATPGTAALADDGSFWRDTLHRAWELTKPEDRAEIIQGMPVADLMVLLADAQRAELFDRIVSQQIAQASPVAATQSSKKLLTNLTVTLHWGLGQADPAKGAQCLETIAAKLAANKRDPKDICLAFAARAKR